MAAKKEPQTQRLHRKNVWKVVRTVVQFLALGALIFVIVRETSLPQNIIHTFVPDETDTASAQVSGDEARFISIAYTGVTESEAQDSAIVSRKSFEAQMAALKASGYQTISQEDIIDAWLYHGSLPAKSLFLIFEDGIRATTDLVQPTLEKNHYRATVCTYAQNFYDQNNLFLSVADVRRLLDSKYWELGTNGWRLSYINIYDRYENYFGHLNAKEFVQINQYLRRDYNHYLMDFLRDEDRLREESLEAMQERVAYDYESMSQDYTNDFDSMPLMYVLMHSNTGMFGTDSLVSHENADHLENLFAMNFNRQGDCLNTPEASIYDLTRMQPQPWWSTNHLLMRIWDDTGDDVAFVTGDAEQAASWYEDVGQTELKEGKIIVTSLPYDTGRTTLKSTLMADVDITATLEGNIVGEQAIYLRSDRSLGGGLRVALENNHLVVRECGADEGEISKAEPMVDIDLFEFDGGATKSEQEDEHEGLIALQKAIIAYDDDQERKDEAAATLAQLEATHVLTLAEGGTPYVPELDISDREDRVLRILLKGDTLSIWIDDRIAVDALKVTSARRGTIALESKPWEPDEDYSQRNLHDDVYDAVFKGLTVTDPATGEVLYSYLPPESAWYAVLWQNVKDIFNKYF